MVVASRRGQRCLPGRQGALCDSNLPTSRRNTRTQHTHAAHAHTRARARSRMLLPARPLAHVLTTAHSRLFAGSEGRARLPPRPTPAVPPRQPPLPCQPPPPLCPPLLRQPPPPRPPSPPCLPWGRVGGIGEGEGGGGGVLPGLHPAFMPFAFVDFEEIVLNVWNIQVAKF